MCFICALYYSISSRFVNFLWIHVCYLSKQIWTQRTTLSAVYEPSVSHKPWSFWRNSLLPTIQYQTGRWIIPRDCSSYLQASLPSGQQAIHYYPVSIIYHRNLRTKSWIYPPLGLLFRLLWIRSKKNCAHLCHFHGNRRQVMITILSAVENDNVVPIFTTDQGIEIPDGIGRNES